MLNWTAIPKSGSSRTVRHVQRAGWPDGGEVALICERRGIALRPWVVRYRAFGANVWGMILVAEKTKKAALIEADRLASLQPKKP